MARGWVWLEGVTRGWVLLEGVARGVEEAGQGVAWGEMWARGCGTGYGGGLIGVAQCVEGAGGRGTGCGGARRAWHGGFVRLEGVARDVRAAGRRCTRCGGGLVGVEACHTAGRGGARPFPKSYELVVPGGSMWIISSVVNSSFFRTSNPVSTAYLKRLHFRFLTRVELEGVAGDVEGARGRGTGCAWDWRVWHGV